MDALSITSVATLKVSKTSDHPGKEATEWSAIFEQLAQESVVEAEQPVDREVFVDAVPIPEDEIEILEAAEQDDNFDVNISTPMDSDENNIVDKALSTNGEVGNEKNVSKETTITNLHEGVTGEKLATLVSKNSLVDEVKKQGAEYLRVVDEIGLNIGTQPLEFVQKTLMKTAEPERAVVAESKLQLTLKTQIETGSKPIFSPSEEPTLGSTEVKAIGTETTVSRTEGSPVTMVPTVAYFTSELSQKVISFNQIEQSTSLQLVAEPEVNLSAAVQDRTTQFSPASVNGNTGAAGNASMPRPVAYQVSQAISEAGTSDVEIRLDPAELGKVRISMAARDGQMVAVIYAERPETLDLLRKNADDLLAEFLEQGFADASLDFQQNEGEEFADDSKSGESTEFFASESNTEPRLTAAPLGETAGLDIRL